ncbi:CDGSH iron-sulfur domain-containing protein [Streptosporangium sp. CA-135522]|uniref:CDGSH iron-sulfur domain-containing protein n=1 Tax=Streptosporangium sp. CA-135522 TaxID=3240072 RepID=UPI003D907A73
MSVTIGMAELLTRARLLDRDLAPGEPLAETVIRPLTAAVAEALAEPEPEIIETGSPADRLWELAKDATRLRVQPGAPEGLIEATAALQHLACLFAEDADSLAARIAELAEIQSGLETRIDVAVDGPYLVTNPSKIINWLGETVSTFPQMALCRCGQSTTKPLCDGSHARVGFSGAKDPARVPDQQDSYEGVQVTVLDNRGVCAHSGMCTDRLSTVFRVDKEPFVAPSGGRADEIIRAVRACPSGALGYAVDGKKAPDPEREPAIEVSKDGPYRVTGGIPLDGDVPREHYSLCRCGHSRNKPFCSGMHYYVGFADPPPSDEPSLFEWAGGLPALTRMTQIFYEKYVPQDDLLAPLFARMSPDHPQRVAAWLTETFGGPKLYTEQYGGYNHMVAEHAGKTLSEQWRARWAQLIGRAADDAGLPTDPEFRAAFAGYIEWGSRIAVENSQPGATPPSNMPVPQWWWVCEAKPGSRVSALATPEEKPQVQIPASDEPVGFAEHVKPLFREMDRKSMSFVFDLWSHEDVTRHADAILDRLRQGTMPCDGAWPAEHVDLFARWITEGTRP